MSRKPRVHVPGGYYHVMMRGNGGCDVFSSPQDRTRFQLLLQEGVERFGHRVHAFCLMTNHIHLLIQVSDTPLSKIIQNLGFRFTRHINHGRKTTGHLFQGRYKAILIDADAYLLQLVRYIHLNPVRAGIRKTSDAFEWSSQAAYEGREIIPWLYTLTVLGQFSTRQADAERLFSDFMLQGYDEPRRPEFHKGSHQGQILGDDGFAERALSASGHAETARTPSLSNVIEAVCREYDIEPSALSGLGKARQFAEPRAMTALIIQDTEGVTLTSLAEVLGRELSSLSQAAGRLYKRKGVDKSVQAKVGRIKNAI